MYCLALSWWLLAVMLFVVVCLFMLLWVLVLLVFVLTVWLMFGMVLA